MSELGNEAWEFLFSELHGDVPPSLTDAVLDKLASHIAIASDALTRRSSAGVKAVGEWRRIPSLNVWSVATPIGVSYWAWERDGRGFWCRFENSNERIEVEGGLAGAQAAVQADFNTRIESALEPLPSHVGEDDGAAAAYQCAEERLCECGAAGSGEGHTDFCPWLASEWKRWGDAFNAALASQTQGEGEPQDVINLVIAAREMLDRGFHPSDTEANALDRALEAFASRVPYENEPDALTPSPTLEPSDAEVERWTALCNAEAAKEVQSAIDFLNEAARYFGKRPTDGEDAAFWSNVANESNCKRIAVLIADYRAALIASRQPTSGER